MRSFGKSSSASDSSEVRIHLQPLFPAKSKRARARARARAPPGPAAPEAQSGRLARLQLPTGLGQILAPAWAPNHVSTWIPKPYWSRFPCNEREPFEPLKGRLKCLPCSGAPRARPLFAAPPRARPPRGSARAAAARRGGVRALCAGVSFVRKCKLGADLLPARAERGARRAGGDLQHRGACARREGAVSAPRESGGASSCASFASSCASFASSCASFAQAASSSERAPGAVRARGGGGGGGGGGAFFKAMADDLHAPPRQLVRERRRQRRVARGRERHALQRATLHPRSRRAVGRCGGRGGRGGRGHSAHTEDTRALSTSTACPISAGCRTRRVRLVRGAGRGVSD